MLPLSGLNIDELPFKDLKILQEILVFEDIPVLVHYSDNNSEDIISYLVDFDETGKRQMFTKVQKDELFSYLIGLKSLKRLFSEIKSDFVFFVDSDNSDNIKSTTLLSKFLIPEKYFPIDESFHDEEINDFYIDYLKENFYYYKLKENAFILTVKPSTGKHGTTVSARDAAFVLANATNSVEGYVSVRSFNALKNDFSDINQIKRKVSATKKFLSPRIAEAAFHSFEVWLAMDTVLFKEKDKYITEIAEGLVQSYKQDVLDVDYTSEEDAKILIEKYSEDERKMIFEPIYKIVENKDFVVSVCDVKNTIKRNNKQLKSSKNFWQKVLPPPTIAQLQEEMEKRNKIVTIVLHLKEGENVTKLTKKELQENLLFSKDDAQTTYDIGSPIVVEGEKIDLIKPISCVLTIDENNHLQLFNDELEIHAEGKDDFNIIVENVKNQFFALAKNLKEIEKKDFSKASIIRSYLHEER